MSDKTLDEKYEKWEARAIEQHYLREAFEAGYNLAMSEMQKRLEEAYESGYEKGQEHMANGL